MASGRNGRSELRRSQWVAIAAAVGLGAVVGLAVAGVPNLGAVTSSESGEIDLELLAPITVPPILTTTSVPPPETTTAPPPSTDPVPDESVPDEEGVETGEEEVVVGRDEVAVAVANGTGRGGEAGRVADDLGELGYVEPQTLTTSRTATTIVIFQTGFENEAIRLALDLGLDIDRVVDIALAPALDQAVTAEVVVVLGRNWSR